MNCIGPTARSTPRVAVEQPGVGVVDARGGAVTGETRAEDRRVDDPVGGHQRAAEPAVVALDLADRGDQLPGEVAGRVGLTDHRLGPLVGRQRSAGDRVDRGEAGVGDHAEPGAVASRLLGDRGGCLHGVGQVRHGRERGIGGGGGREGQHGPPGPGSGRNRPTVAATESGARTATRQTRLTAAARPNRPLPRLTGLPRSRPCSGFPHRCPTGYPSSSDCSPRSFPSIPRYVCPRADIASSSLRVSPASGPAPYPYCVPTLAADTRGTHRRNGVSGLLA